MSGFPRVAVGSLGNHPPPGPIVWALAGYLTQQGRQVRHFFSRACYCSLQGALTATGLASRYIDCWLTSRDESRMLLAESYRAADFALFEGTFAPESNLLDSGVRTQGDTPAGTLDELCRRLDLPRLIVLDAAHAVDCRIPSRPESVDGVLVDGILEDADFIRIQTCLEGAWGVPVVGGLKRNEAVRQRLASLTPGGVVPKEVCEQLIRSFADFVQPSQLEAICRRMNLPTAPVRAEAVFAVPSSCEPTAARNRSPTVAVAYDDAFCGYFADMLESLELHGARVVDFSPLADESIPDDSDIVLLGCGRPDVHADELAANQCMMSSLRSYARRGGRIYAEGGGLAYLGRAIRTGDGRALPMTNLFPLASARREGFAGPEPIEFSVDSENWLLPIGEPIRAYRSDHWKFELMEPTVEVLAGSAEEVDLWRVGNVVGGRLQLHLSAQPALLRGFFRPAASVPHQVVAVG